MISTLVVDETFVSRAAHSETSVTDRDTVTVGSTSAETGELTISYDAESNSYSLSYDTISADFARDARSGLREYEYRWTNPDGRDVLTLTTRRGIDRNATNQSVGAGLWQHYAEGSDVLQSSAFVYGWQTPLEDVPTTGLAHYLVSVLGIWHTPGARETTLRGEGELHLNLGTMLFALDGTGGTSDGEMAGSYDFAGGGTINVDGTFEGLMGVYSAGMGTSVSTVLDGAFYGDAGEEVGATFSGSENGMSVTGAMIGWGVEPDDRDYDHRNFSLVDAEFVEEMGVSAALFEVSQYKDGRVGGWYGVLEGPWNRGVEWGPDGVSLVRTQDFLIDVGDTAPDPDDPTFERFVTTNPDEDQDVVASVYVPGNGNDELALTYASFVRVEKYKESTDPSGALLDIYQTSYHLFGAPTAALYTRARTGSASYSGIIYGAGADENERYSLTGTSSFAFDFDDENFTGALAIQGIGEGGTTTDFGSWLFDGAIAQDGRLTQPWIYNSDFTDNGSQIRPYFFGPLGNELGATFSIEGFFHGVETELIGVTLATQN